MPPATLLDGLILLDHRAILAGALIVLASVAPGIAQPAVRLDTPADPTGANPADTDKSGYTLFNPTPDAALRTFSPDRPTKSNGPLTVDAGRLQYETDLVNYTHSNAGGISTRTFVALDPTLKVGLTQRVDLELQFNGYTTMHAAGPGTATLSQADGAGDLVVRGKVNLFGNDGGSVAMALIPYVKLPTAARTLGNNQVEGGVIAPLLIMLPAGFTLTIMPEFDVLKNAADSGKHLNATGVLDIGYAIDKKWTVFGEVYAAAGTDARTPAVYTADAAAAYLLTETVQLDAGVNVGLNRNAPNLQLYTGISQRF